MKPPTVFVVLLDGDTVIQKRAIGPEQNLSTGVWTAPEVPAGWQVVTADEYIRIDVGWERSGLTWTPPLAVRPAERIARIEARLKVLIASANDRMTALETRLTTAEARLSAGETRLTTAEGNISTLTTGGNQLRNRVTNLETRVTALERGA